MVRGRATITGAMSQLEQERLVTTRHSGVPGRLRLGIAGLIGHPSQKAGVESALSVLEGVREVSANPLTGNVLVLYDPADSTVFRLRGRGRTGAERRKRPHAPS